MPDEYVHVALHPHTLASGRSVGHGDRITPGEIVGEDRKIFPEDQILIDEGILVDVDSFDGPSNKEAIEDLAESAASRRKSSKEAS